MSNEFKNLDFINKYIELRWPEKNKNEINVKVIDETKEVKKEGETVIETKSENTEKEDYSTLYGESLDVGKTISNALMRSIFFSILNLKTDASGRFTINTLDNDNTTNLCLVDSKMLDNYLTYGSVHCICYFLENSIDQEKWIVKDSNDTSSQMIALLLNCKKVPTKNINQPFKQLMMTCRENIAKLAQVKLAESIMNNKLLSREEILNMAKIVNLF